MKKRISIYIDGDVWEGVKDQAWKERMSASAFLEQVLTRKRFIEDETVPVEAAAAGLIRENKSDRIKLQKPSPIIVDPVTHLGASVYTGEKKTDSEILAEGQKKLDAMREKLERKKGESNAAWQIRKRVFERGAK